MTARNDAGRFVAAPRPGTRVKVTTGSRAGAEGIIANGSATKRGFVRVILTSTPDGTALPFEARGFGQYRTDTLERI